MQYNSKLYMSITIIMAKGSHWLTWARSSFQNRCLKLIHMKLFKKKTADKSVVEHMPGMPGALVSNAGGILNFFTLHFT